MESCKILVKGEVMKIVFWGRKIEIPKAYIVIAALILLIILVLWGWYLKVNNVDVFVVSDGSSVRSNQPENIGMPVNDKNQTHSGETMPTGGSVSAAAKVTGKVNINTADVESLMSLKGIGVAKANAVIAYRQQNGPFKSIEEIMNVKGIKKATFEKIKDSISVE
jgi:comEA protein